MSTAMARAIAAATARGGRGRVGALRRADLEPREGVLRRRRPQGAQQLHRRRPHGAAPGRPGGLRRRARPARARDRRRRRLRPRAAASSWPCRATSSSRARAPSSGCPRSASASSPAAAARSCSCAGSGGRGRRGRSSPRRGSQRRRPSSSAPSTRSCRPARRATGRSSWPGPSRRNSPVGLRNAKRAMRLGADVGLDAGLEIEDGCWRATAFSGDRREGVAAFAEKRRPGLARAADRRSLPCRSPVAVRVRCGPLSIGSRRSVRPRAGRS